MFSKHRYYTEMLVIIKFLVNCFLFSSGEICLFVLRVNTAILRKTLKLVVNFCSVRRNIIACMIQHNCTRWNLGVCGEITPSTIGLVSAHNITHTYTHIRIHARTCAYLIIYTLKRKDLKKGRFKHEEKRD